MQLNYLSSTFFDVVVYVFDLSDLDVSHKFYIQALITSNKPSFFIFIGEPTVESRKIVKSIGKMFGIKFFEVNEKTTTPSLHGTKVYEYSFIISAHECKKALEYVILDNNTFPLKPFKVYF